ALVAGKSELDITVVDEAGGHAKGFLGIEYLLFSRDGDAAALARLSDDDEQGFRRRTLVRLMGDELLASAHELNDAWDPAKGGYATEIEQAGAGSKRYPTQRAALDDVVGGIAFALELVVGVRLAEPLGKRADGTPDPALDPTSASDSASADMRATLDGVRALYDDGLAGRARSKSTALDERIRTQLDSCRAGVESIPSPFRSALTDDTAKVESAYQACKVAKSTWNTDVTSALGATLKPSDNDGD
ncbi:MAG TPA: imelysin family protein, partial [Polyangiaceae bacterium]|nr:imelysin family protein [Polyangiaceae bacterium]